MGANMVAYSLFLATVALSAPVAAKTAPYSKAQIENFRAVSNIAKQTCTAPETVGYTMNANGSAVVSFAPDKLISRFVAFGGKLGAGGAYARWSGPLQRDVGAALAARSNCQQAVFAAMVNRLPLADPSNGRLIPKPSRPITIFKQVQASAAPIPAISNTGNNSGQQINSTASATINAPNGPTTNGPGSAVQYNYFGAPVTADQKQQARDALLINLREIAHYPERGSVDRGPTIMLNTFEFKAPHALYVLLSKYDRDTISSLPHGDELNRYELDYYKYELSSLAFERRVLPHIGEISGIRWGVAINQCYIHAILRASGWTMAQVKGAQTEANIMMTTDEHERIFNILISDPNYGPELKKSVENVTLFTNRTNELLKLFDY